MSYVNGEWLDRKDRAKRIDMLTERVRKIKALYERGDATDGMVDTMLADIDELKRLKRVHRAEHDVLYFGMEYFSEDGNPGNDDNLIPAGVTVENAAAFHRELTEMLNNVTLGKAKRHIAWACPRRHAKTAWLSNIFLVHQIVFRHRKYIALFSETTDTAGDFITWGRYQLKLNEKLREDFGELLHPQPSRNELDNKYEFITTSNIKVEAKGLGTQVRGMRHGSTRPDLFILDDIESDESTSTPEQIAKAKAWFNDSMLPALAKDGLVIYLGTILCYGSLLHHVIEDRRDFEARKFAAVESFASRTDLWDEWRKIYRSDTRDAADRALEFFEQNKAAMLEGTKILWPEYWSYYDLILIREESGTKTFNQEYQNNPTDEDRQIFKPEYFTYFVESDLDGKKLKYYGAVDFAMGKEKGDYSVIVTMAKNEETDICYVVDVFMQKCHPDVLLREAIERVFKYQYEALAVEAQAAQEFFADKLSEELSKRGFPSHTRLKQIKQRTRKSYRIESLLPDIQAGRIRFRKVDKEAMEQFEMYPMTHDDFPDACHMAYTAAKGGNATVQTVRVLQRR